MKQGISYTVQFYFSLLVSNLHVFRKENLIPRSCFRMEINAFLKTFNSAQIALDLSLYLKHPCLAWEYNMGALEYLCNWGWSWGWAVNSVGFTVYHSWVHRVLQLEQLLQQLETSFTPVGDTVYNSWGHRLQQLETPFTTVGYTVYNGWGHRLLYNSWGHRLRQ